MISGLMPDYKVEQKREDSERGIDTVLKFCIDMTKNNVN